MTAGYFTLRNFRTSPDILRGVECDFAAQTEMHRTVTEGLEMKMVPMQQVAVPAGSDVRFESGGMHLMIVGLKRDLVAGEKVTLRLLFAKTPPLNVSAKVTHAL